MTSAATFLPGKSPSTPWQQRGSTAQPLLLSKTPVFDVSSHGAVLGPGMRYRLCSVNAGVAEVEVETEDGLEIGYCPAQLVGAQHVQSPLSARILAIGAAVVAAIIVSGIAALLV
jgi:hypothetical protein